MDIQSLKFKCYDLLVQEAQIRKIKYNIEFKWQLFDKIGTIEIVEKSKIKVSINLRAVKGQFVKKVNNTMFHLYASICYLANYILLLAGESSSDTETIFEQMAGAYALSDLQSGRKVDMFSPSVLENKRIDRCFRLTPCEVWCAVKAVCRAKEICSELLSEGDKISIERQLEEWELYGFLPEIVYQGSNIPQYARFDILQMMQEEFGQESKKEYRKKCVEYIQKVGDRRTKLLYNNRIAIERKIKIINKAMEQEGSNNDSGTIHPLGF